MSMKITNKQRTLCEVLREINDIHQGEGRHAMVVRTKLAEAEKMAKKMSKKLYEYNKEYDAGWWEENPRYEEALRARMNKRYCTG